MAAEFGQADIVKLLLEHGADPNVTDNEGFTPLDICCEFGADEFAPEIIEILLRAGAPVSFGTAVRVGDFERVIQFLDTNPQLLNQPAPDSNSMTPLMIACRCGRLEIVRELLRRGADANAREGQANSALWFAAQGRRKGRVLIAKLLVERRAEVDFRGENGETPLLIAAAWGHTDMVEFLIDAGADVNLKSDNGETALSSALKRDHTDTAAVLRNLGATATADAWDAAKTQTAASFAEVVQGRSDLRKRFFEAVSGNDVAQVRRLLAASPTLVHSRMAGDTRLLGMIWTRENSHTPLPPDDSRNCTALHFAAHYGHAELAEVLLEHGADPNALGYDNNASGPCSPIELAAWEGGIDVLRVLLEHGADPNVNDGAALYTAARHGARDRCELLLASGARPNLLTAARLGLVHRLRELSNSGIPQEKLTLALEEAVHGGQRDAAEFLVSRGARLTLTYAAGLGMLDKVKEFVVADPSSVNPADGSETPLMAAARNGDVEVVRYLLDHGADVHLGRRESIHRVQPIHVAKAAVVELLVRAGADVNEPYRGFTPLQRAISREDSELAETLARLGGTKRFHLVGHLSATLVEPLIRLGSDVNEIDADGKTALDHALENHQKTVTEAPATSKRFGYLADLLRKHGAKTSPELKS